MAAGDRRSLANDSVKNANPLSFRTWVVLISLALAGCGPKPPGAADSGPFKTVADAFPIRIGDRTASLQVAVLQPEEERGLMERTDLGPDQGMIFVDPAPHQLNFWMHDTPTPLEIGYFTADGQLAEIYPLLPFDERTVSSIRRDLQFAVEMNRGWYESNGVRVGDRIDLRALSAAMRARGFDPARFGLPGS
jgi:uncharacterized membrane protein (UPF0127 family)